MYTIVEQDDTVRVIYDDGYELIWRHCDVCEQSVMAEHTHEHDCDTHTNPDTPSWLKDCSWVEPPYTSKTEFSNNGLIPPESIRDWDADLFFFEPSVRKGKQIRRVQTKGGWKIVAVKFQTQYPDVKVLREVGPKRPTSKRAKPKCDWCNESYKGSLYIHLGIHCNVYQVQLSETIRNEAISVDKGGSIDLNRMPGATAEINRELNGTLPIIER